MVLEVLPKDTVVITADRHSRLLKGRHLDFVLSGFTVPASQSGLTLPVEAGVAFISGYRVEHTATENLTMVNNSTNYVFLLKDGTWHIDQDNTQPADSIPICSATTSGGNITSTADKRNLQKMQYADIKGALTPIMITMHQQKKDYADLAAYDGSGLPEKTTLSTTYVNVPDYPTVTVNESTFSGFLPGKKYQCKYSAYLRAGNAAGPVYSQLSGYASEVSRSSTTYGWVTSGLFDVLYGAVLQPQFHTTYDYTARIQGWKLLLKYDMGYVVITPANQGFTTLRCIQILLNQNDQAKITKMDDSTQTYTNSAASCLASSFENENLPKNVLPMQLKKIERLAGSPMVIIYDGG